VTEGAWLPAVVHQAFQRLRDWLGVRLARILALALLLIGLSAASVVAQAPTPAPSISVAFETDSGTVSLDKPGEFKAKVTNTGQVSPPPFNEQNAGDVVIDITGAPQGWTVSVVPAHFKLAPGASQDVIVMVAIAADSAQKSVEITIQATMRTPFEGLEPIVGNIPGGTQTATASDVLSVTRSDSLTRGVLEAIGPWIYLVLLLMVGAVLVAVGLTVAARRALVRLSSQVHELPVAPGNRVTFPIHIESLAKETDNVLLRVSTVSDGWAAFLPVPELTLESGAAQDMTLVVIAPSDAVPGTKQPILVTATSAKAPRGEAALEFIAVVEEGEPPAAVKAPKRKK
jgi:hypothetical protein